MGDIANNPKIASRSVFGTRIIIIDIQQTFYKMSLKQETPAIQCVPEKRKPINQVNFSENCNDLSEKVYIVTKFSLSSFFWRQL